MKSPRLTSMSLEALSTLRKKIDGIITKKLKQERARFEGLLRDLDGFVATPVVKRGRPPEVDRRKGKRGKAPIKYRGPKPGEKWSGRGMTPRWLTACIKAGKKKESFLVK